MSILLSRQEAKVLIAFRRSAYALDIKSIAEAELSARRAIYEETYPASEELRKQVLDTRDTLDILFNEEVIIKE